MGVEKDVVRSELTVMSEEGSKIVLHNVGKQLAKAIFEKVLSENPRKEISVQNVYFKKEKDLESLPKGLLKKLNIQKHSPKIKPSKLKVIFVARKQSYSVYNGVTLVGEFGKVPQVAEEVFRIVYPARVEAARIDTPDLK